jgi:hypothetical protein
MVQGVLLVSVNSLPLAVRAAEGAGGLITGSAEPSVEGAKDSTPNLTPLNIK